ncbi:hypothetical protein ACFLVC_04740 [Chloroflexota bacterium]
MSKEAVLTVLNKATEDADFYGQLGQNITTALRDYDLTQAEIIAIRTGDVCWVESHIGVKIDNSLMEKFFIPLLSREQW